MSLAVLANTMASKGRNGDSMLVHMSPDEVKALQALAQRHGKTLTINPETGQPEAFNLKSLLPLIAGFALGPAGFGLMSAGMAAATVGGITALSTGDISRGLMAGLGAYGGASLGSSLMDAGTEALASEATKAAAIPAEQAGDWMAQEAANRSVDAQLASKTAGDRLSAGFSAATESPTAAANFAKANYKPLAAAAAPIMADAMVSTTTGMPRPMDTGYIRQKKFNPYTQQYIDLEPVKASEWGSRRFSDYADGGIVALAKGGASDQGISDLVNQAYASIGRSGIGTGASNIDQPGYDYWTQQLASGAVTPENFQNTFKTAVGSYMADKPQDVYTDYVGDYAVNKYATPTGSAADFLGGTSNLGITNRALEVALQNADLSDAARYALTHSDVGVGASQVGGFKGLNSAVLNYLKQNPNATQADIDAAQTRYGYNDVDLVRPYADGHQLLQGQDRAAQKYLQDNPDVAAWTRTAEGRQYMQQHPEFDANDIAWTHYLRYGAQEGRAWGALAPTGTVYNNGAYGAYGSGPSVGVDYLGRTVSTATPGDVITNPDQTRTVVPNIPGRPYGGFTGMDKVKSAYTAGGGSLGPTNLFVPQTVQDMYNRYTTSGGSQQAYEYLMNKGSASIQKPVTRTGELMLPYAQSVLGQEMPATTSASSTQKYIFDSKNKRYIPNPAYVDPTKTTIDPNVADTPSYIAGGGVVGMALGGLGALAAGGQAGYNLGSYSDGGRLLRGPGDGVSDSIPATIGDKQPARLADGEFVVPARIVSELGNGSTEAGARKLYAMMDRVQRARGKTTGKNRVAKDTQAERFLPA